MTQVTDVVVLQNYFTPYRRALFEAVGAELDALTVVHSRRPDQDGRRWTEEGATHYQTLRAPSVALGPLVFFALPWRLLRRARQTLFVLHDDNPANLSMIGWAALLRLLGVRTLLWSEHVPDDGRGVKLAYQRACSFLLTRLVRRTIAFSQLTETYVRELAPHAAIDRMIQSVPQPRDVPPARIGPVRRFGFMGSAHPRKNLAALLQAFAATTGGELHVAGILVGSEDPRIHWWGYVDGAEREQFFATIDMLVLPSLKEPWGLVVNEALDRGALAMVSTASGSRELVEAINPALVFEPTPEGIAVALRHWFGRDVDAVRQRAAEAAGAYSTAAAARRLLEIIDAARR